MNVTDIEGAQAFFGLLGKLLQNEPSAESIALISKEGLFESLPYASNNEHVQREQAELLKWLSDSSVVLDVRADYMRLFAGVGSAVRPYSSYYITNERLTFQADTLKIREIYKRYGLELVLKNQEPDDHIGFELEFIAHLLGLGEVEFAKDFADKYVKTWVFKWLESVEKYASTGYYKGLASIAAGGIEHFTGVK